MSYLHLCQFVPHTLGPAKLLVTLLLKWDIDMSLKFKKLKLLVSAMATSQATLTFPEGVDMVSAD